MTHFDVRTYFKVVQAVFTDRPSFKRLATHIGLLIALPLWAVSNTLCLWLDHLLFPAFRRREVRAPVFIVGNARSGTTLFHRLLCEDREQFAHFKAWEILLPSVLQRRIVHGLGALGRRLFGGRVRRGLARWEDESFASLRTMHPIGLNAPEEDEFLMLIPFNSAVLNVLFPYPDQLGYLNRFDSWDARLRQSAMRYYRGCVQRQLFLGGEGVTLVSKNPAFVAKLRSLRETFPDARFVYLVRNPYETIPSLLKLLSHVWRRLGIDERQIQRAAHEIAEGCINNYHYGLQFVQELPESSCAVVRYDDLIADPKAAVEAVYRRLGLAVSPELDRRLEEERRRARAHSSKHAYSLEEFGLERAQLASRLRGVFERFGWEP